MRRQSIFEHSKTAFIGVDVVHEGQNMVSITKSRLLNPASESLGQIVAESPGPHVGVPPGELVIRALEAIFPGPGEGFRVAGTVLDKIRELRIVHAKELAGPEVHAGAQIVVVIFLELSCGVKADLVAETGKVDQAIDFKLGAARVVGAHATNLRYE